MMILVWAMWEGKCFVLLAKINANANVSASSRIVSLIMDTDTQLVFLLYCDCPETKVRNQGETVTSLPSVAVYCKV